MADAENQIDVVKKSKSALFALSTRSIILYALQIFSRIVLAKNLLAQDFGVFGILQGWIGSLMFLTDIGLGDVLSRKSGKISDRDFSSYFFIRITLSIFASVIFILIYPMLQEHYGFTFNYSNFAFFIFIFLILDVLAACPMMLMGQKMEFVKIAKIELVSLILTYIVQIFSSYVLTGPWSFFAGLFSGKVLAVIMSFYYSEKIPVPKFDQDFFKINYVQGILFQISTILPSLQAILLPLVMSYFLKTNSIGLIFWIEGLVTIPLALIFNYNRVAFVSLSKFANDPDRLRDIVSRFFIVMSLGICVVFGLGAVLSKSIILLIFGSKWAEAVNYIHFSCIAFGIYSLRFLGLSVLSAINTPKIRIYNELTLVILTSILLIIFGRRFEMIGYFYATIVSYSVCFLIMIFSIRRCLHLAVYRRIFSVLMAMLISIVAMFKSNIIDANLIIIMVTYLSLFFVVSILLDRTVFDDIKKYAYSLKSKIF